LEYADGDIRGYDVSRIESELRYTLLPSAEFIALQVRQFQYAGELRQSDGIARLKAIVTQEPLSSAFIDQVRSSFVL